MIDHPILAVTMTAMFAVIIVRRVRRSFGRQRFRPFGLVFVVGLMSAIATILLLVSRAPLAAQLAGAGMGTALALWALSLTRFGVDATGRFYVPNGAIGLCVLMLFFGRMLVRLWGLGDLLDRVGGPAAPGQAAAPSITSSPGTMLVMFVLLGYYVAYYGGVLLRGVRLDRAA